MTRQLYGMMPSRSVQLYVLGLEIITNAQEKLVE
jgi:hypothetical protein